MLTSMRSSALGPRMALGGVLVAASIGLAACATRTTVPPRHPHTPSAIPSGPAGYYKDAAADYAITFPGKPSIAPVDGSDSGAMRATYSTEPDPTATDAVYYTAAGTTASDVDISPTDLDGDLLQLVNQGAKLTSQETKFTLDGMPAVMSDFTGPDGKPGTIVIAGEGHSFYQLIVRGGTTAQRQTFFDSFKLLN